MVDAPVYQYGSNEPTLDPATEWSDNTCKVRSKYVFKKGWRDQNHEDFIMLKQREVAFLCSANLEKKPPIYSEVARNATLKF